MGLSCLRGGMLAAPEFPKLNICTKQVGLLPRCSDYRNSLFIETILNFMGVSLTLFAVAHLYMAISHNKIIKPTVKCRYCKKFISVEVRLQSHLPSSVHLLIAYQAKRCLNCSSWQDGREDLPGDQEDHDDDDSTLTGDRA